MAHSGITEAAFIAKLCSLNGTDLGVRLDFFSFSEYAGTVCSAGMACTSKQENKESLLTGESPLCICVCSCVCSFYDEFYACWLGDFYCYSNLLYDLPSGSYTYDDDD